MANKISSVESIAGPLDYVEYVKTVLNTGGNYPFVIKGGGVANIQIDKKLAPPILKAAEKIKDRDQALAFLKDSKYVIATYQNQQLPIGSLVKPSGKKIESGYLAEAILQAAIAARLVIRDKDVAPSDVVKFLKDFISSNKIWNTGKKSKAVNKITEYNASNLGKNFKDKVINYMSLNDKAFRYLENNIESATSNPNIRSFFTDSVNYVNRSAPKEHSKYFYTNQREDLLKIESLGILGQGITKADIKTIYLEGYNPKAGFPGTEVDFNLNLSVKINEETQFGQASNVYSEAMQRFASSVGVKLSKDVEEKIKKLIPTKIKGTKIQPVMPHAEIKQKKLHTKVYELVYNDIAKQLDNKPKTDALLDGIIEFISLNDPTLVIIDIGMGDKLYFVNKIGKSLRKQLKGKNLKAEIKAQPSGNYKMTISIEGGEVIVLESRPTGGAFRNFVSSGKALRKWIAEI